MSPFPLLPYPCVARDRTSGAAQPQHLASLPVRRRSWLHWLVAAAAIALGAFMLRPAHAQARAPSPTLAGVQIEDWYRVCGASSYDAMLEIGAVARSSSPASVSTRSTMEVLATNAVLGLAAEGSADWSTFYKRGRELYDMMTGLEPRDARRVATIRSRCDLIDESHRRRLDVSVIQEAALEARHGVERTLAGGR